MLWRGLLLTVAVLGLLGAPPAHAQGVDIAVETVHAVPASPRAGEPVSVVAALRRRDMPSMKSPALPVEVLVEFFADAGRTPFARETVTLRPGQSATVRASWRAEEGKHELRARIARVTLGGRPVKDLGAANDEARSAPIVVAAAAPPPSAPAAPPPPAGAAARTAGPAGPVTLSTEGLSMIGSAAAPPPPAATPSPVAVSTEGLSVIGSAAAPLPAATFSPVTVTTDGLSMLGAP